MVTRTRVSKKLRFRLDRTTGRSSSVHVLIVLSVPTGQSVPTGSIVLIEGSAASARRERIALLSSPQRDLLRS